MLASLGAVARAVPVHLIQDREDHPLSRDWIHSHGTLNLERRQMLPHSVSDEGLTVQKFLESFQEIDWTDSGFDIQGETLSQHLKGRNLDLAKYGKRLDLALYAKSTGADKTTPLTAVFLLPTADVRTILSSFALDTDAARYLRFLKHDYDVYVFRVGSIEDAQRAIAAVTSECTRQSPQKFVGINHLDIGGHGTGPDLRLGPKGDLRSGHHYSLRLDDTRSEYFFEWLARPSFKRDAPLAPHATIFLNSC